MQNLVVPVSEVTATQGPGSVTQRYQLEIGDPANSIAPEILPATLIAPANQLFTFDVSARDEDNDYPLSFALIDDLGRERSAHNGFTITPSGTVS